MTDPLTHSAQRRWAYELGERSDGLEGTEVASGAAKFFVLSGVGTGWRAVSTWLVEVVMDVEEVTVVVLDPVGRGSSRSSSSSSIGGGFSGSYRF
jgi:hypothetical protein